jgi:hypothetical protein
MEENKQPRKRVQKPVGEPMTKAKVRTPDKNDRILELASAGFNVNQIGSMLGVHTQYIKELLAKQ